MREVQDIWFRRAKEEGYRARSAFKLLQIDDRRKVLRRGDRVLDVGAAPGSWTQVAAARVGPTGFVCAFDLKLIDPKGFSSNVRVMQEDLNDLDADSFDGELFNVVISDIGPDTSGDASGDSIRSVELCNTLLDRLPVWLKKGGNVVMKVYEGGGYPELLRRTKKLFREVKGVKPESSRRESVEMFIVGHDYRSEQLEQPRQSDAKKRGWGE